VVFVQAKFGLGQQHLALALAAFGAGSMIVALTLPRLLDNVPDRPVMLAGAATLTLATAAAALANTLPVLMGVWLVIGAGYSMALTPSGRLLLRSAASEDRPALFAAQFALSHACWLLTYPLAGWLGSRLGLGPASLILAAIAAAGLFAAMLVWPHETAEKTPTA